MNILLINGSPKGEQSDTLHLTRAFLRGMSAAGPLDITVIEAAAKDIAYCRGCLTCMRNGGACVIRDDMEEILGQILSSDLLLFSFPLYYFGIPAPLKALLDRTLPLSTIAMQKTGDRYQHISNHDFSKLRYIMISGCGLPNAVHNFEPLRIQFSMIFPQNLLMLTIPQSPLFNIPEAAPVTSPFLASVEQAGREYGETGAVSPSLLEILSRPMIPEEDYARICSGFMD